MQWHACRFRKSTLGPGWGGFDLAEGGSIEPVEPPWLRAWYDCTFVYKVTKPQLDLLSNALFGVTQARVYSIYCRLFIEYKSRQLLTLSTLTTLAPKSDKIIPQKGAGARPANSTTFKPFKAMANALQNTNSHISIKCNCTLACKRFFHNNE